MNHDQVKLLDHGYLQFIESWGTGLAGVATEPFEPAYSARLEHDYEVGIIEAARQSTQGGFRGWDPAPCDCDAPMPHMSGKDFHSSACASIRNPGDRRLLAFLYDKRHSTPFEFAGMTIEVRAPISVFREWHRHRTESYSEASARYAPLPALDYVPTVKRCVEGSEMTENKQAGSVGGRRVTPADADGWLLELAYHQKALEGLYQRGLAMGIPKELARGSMTVFRYSQMRATANLRNWLAFMTLRTDPAAQWEIRQYANQVAAIIREVFPETYRKWANIPG